jgi:hypothetical protein
VLSDRGRQGYGYARRYRALALIDQSGQVSDDASRTRFNRYLGTFDNPTNKGDEVCAVPTDKVTFSSRQFLFLQVCLVRNVASVACSLVGQTPEWMQTTAWSAEYI